jgi:glycosyltransferase involved in cell wall biosynthesis
MNIVLFTETLGRGFGVSIVVQQQALYLSEKGHAVRVVHIEGDGWKTLKSQQIEVIQVKRNLRFLNHYLNAASIDLVIAHSSPFYEKLASLSTHIYTIVWEHGDPYPKLFPQDQWDWRKNRIEYKKKNVYPFVNQVIAISQFIKSEIGCSAQVIYNGIDHLQSQCKSTEISQNPIVICISRLSLNESHYKGTHEFAELAQKVQVERPEIRFQLIGKGTQEESAFWKEKGLEVFASVDENELIRLIEESSILVSLSLWEGFNLPLVEAQYRGKIAMALDCGAHREVTPWVYNNIDEIKDYIVNYSFSDNAQNAIKAKNFIHEFTWSNHGNALSELFTGITVRTRKYSALKCGAIRCLWILEIHLKKWIKKCIPSK